MKRKTSDSQPRRDFLKTTSIGLAGFALLSLSRTNSSAQSPLAGRLPGRVYPLNHNWLYSERNLPNAASPTLDDSRFTRVTIPHTNKLLPWHGFDDKDYQFVSLYRRHFKIPIGTRGKRIFVDFGGVMTAATVSINGTRLGEYRGGYTPFSYELTSHLNWPGDNVLAVEVDSTERKDIPPFGGEIDYLTFGGIYRDVQLRIVSPTFIDNVFAKPVNVLKDDRRVDVRCFLNGQGGPAGPFKLTAELRDRERVIATATADFPALGAPHYDLSLKTLRSIQLWDLDHPKLYQVRVKLSGNQADDHYEMAIGFREANFSEDGFYLNGKHVKLRGLNRHQTFPYVGQAMPARVQRRDALILKQELKCNVVRTSHYPQSPHFLNACDEIGLLVFEEIPGWQHIG
ncbi:MAG TPA: glycoside hydrolase family 2 TIM barrel-domain containing protein, partial [Pyrinomonadaceae bacterium]|nr:glycoside hydrolase family 2 TIM barrel-domain containing protein [Pyrinomonadaceae bacterium]